MHTERLTKLVLAALLVPAAVCAAQDEDALTLEQALARARERSPVILAARARIEEAMGRRLGASLRLRGNPTFEAAAGRREADGDRSTDLELGVSQGLGAAGSRGARLAGAEAAVEAERAAADGALRDLAAEVAATFLRALHAGERLALERESLGVAEEVARIADRRLRAGDVAILDLRMAEAALARSRAEVHAAEADESALLGELKILIAAGPGEAVRVIGALDRDVRLDLRTLLDGVASRPDLRSLAAGIDEAEAGVRLARTYRRPEIEVGMGYEREEEADVILGGVTLALPILDRGQGAAAEAEARVARLKIEREAALRAAEERVRAAFEAHEARLRAAGALGAILPGLEESEALAARSYEAGQVSLVELLLLRREILETRRARADRLLEAALAAVALESAAGVLS